jgi:imidazolonepropionase-like amidohydrolase
MAGFWNSHVHFTESKWEDAAEQPASKLAAQLQSMLTGAGFTTVVDTGSLLANTAALRRRIESGEIPGPRIYTAGTPVYPPDGIPYYVKESSPPGILKQLVPPRNPGEAQEAAALNIQNGADIVKVFTGSWIARGTVLPMPEPIAAAVVKVAHEHHRLVFTHPSSLVGIQVAIASGVDVLAHAPDDTRGMDDAVLRKAIANHMAMIPTLKLFSGEDDIGDIRHIVSRFHQLGGELIFGTDTGYLTDYDVGEEFRQLGKAGLRAAGIQFSTPTRREISPHSRVRYTIRAGRVVYSHAVGKR